MIRTTRWSPDTCGCIIDYDWDDTVPETARVHTLKAVINRCPAHSLGPDPDVYKTVIDENTRKNGVLALAQGILPALEVGNYSWHFDAARLLQVTIPGLTVAQKSILQGQSNARFGAGKVQVN